MRDVTSSPDHRSKSRRLSAAGVGLAFALGMRCASPQPPAGPRDREAAPRRPTTGETAGTAGAADATAPGQAAKPLPPAAPVLPGPALAAREAAQRRVLGEAPFGAAYFDAPQRLEIAPDQPAAPDAAEPTGDAADVTPPAALPIDALTLGRFVPLQGAGDPALSAFHHALGELASGQRDGKVRVAFYGSSQTSADFITGYLRTYLQRRFGDGGHGFVALAKPWRTYRHLDVGLNTSKGWHTDHAQKSDRREDGYYGLLGASTSARRRGRRTSIRARGAAVGTRFELQFLQQPRGGSFILDVNGRRQAQIKTRAKEHGPGYYAFELEPGLHELRVRVKGDGEVRLFGVVIENDEPGVVVDTLGINGARVANQLTWDEALWADAFRRRSPSLFVLAYGGNECTDTDVPMSVYTAELEQVLQRYRRVAPESSCLLMGPGDFPEETPDGGRQPRARLREIVRTQDRVAARYGCAFWDTQAFMGGEMGMTRWVEASPTMAQADHLHLTRRGYTRLGMALADAMMQGYDAAGREPGPRAAID
ncbi:MAG: hypothetical protein B7733_16160 [Myxococcales bacterium FL481]|nr:MAG: hypothetical protein B7733_16160 [Myxococcales bacterium FL481]